jgi:hypothetical protein
MDFRVSLRIAWARRYSLLLETVKKPGRRQANREKE